MHFTNYRRKIPGGKAGLKISDAKASSHPRRELYRSILDCYQNIQEKASIIRHVQLNVSSMEDAQGLVIKIGKQLELCNIH